MGKRLVIGMSGASGAPLTVELLRQLRKNHPEAESRLIVTGSAELTLAQETDVSLGELRALAHVCHEKRSIGASVASGSRPWV